MTPSVPLSQALAQAQEIEALRGTWLGSSRPLTPVRIPEGASRVLIRTTTDVQRPE